MATSTTTTTIPVNIQGFYDRNLLERATPALLHSRFAQQRPLPKNQGSRINFRRYGSLTAATTPLTEGTTPAGKQLSVTDIYATVAQYGDFVQLTDFLLMTGLDKTVLEAQEVLGEQAGDTLDQVHRDVIVAGTVVRYANGAARGDVNTALAADDLDSVIRTLEAANAKKIREIKVGGMKINTYPIRPSYIAIGHTHLRKDIEAISGFKSVEEYASQGDVMPEEIGAIKNVRFLLTTNGKVWPDDGGTKGTMISTTGTDADVYALMVLGKNAYGVTALVKDSIRTIVKSLSSAGTEDPLEQRSTVGWKTSSVCKILNDSFMARIECAATDL